MKGKTEFTNSEAGKIRELIDKKVLASTNEQKILRDKIRQVGFYFSDFSPSKHNYTVADFENLRESGLITITNDTK